MSLTWNTQNAFVQQSECGKYRITRCSAYDPDLGGPRWRFFAWHLPIANSNQAVVLDVCDRQDDARQACESHQKGQAE